MIVAGNINEFAIVFSVNEKISLTKSRIWFYGSFVLYINGVMYGNNEDEVSLEHCASWIKGLMEDRLINSSYCYEKFPLEEYRYLPMEKIIEMVNAITTSHPCLDCEYLEKKYRDYVNNIDYRQYKNKCMAMFRDINITNIGMSSFDSIDLLLLMIDYSDSIKRFIILEHSKESQKGSEYFISSRVVYDVFCEFLEKYEFEKRKIEVTTNKNSNLSQ